jgi:hypothetical protein
MAITTDSAGNVYVTGQTGAGSESDYATAKYDPFGVERWTRTYDGPGQDEDVAVAIAVDSAGNVYVTGYSVGLASSETDYATIKYDPAGTLLWVARYNSPVDQPDEPAAIALDGEGNVYVTGRSSNSGIWFDYDYATLKYSPSGAEVWVARYNGAGDDWDQARDIAIDGSGNVYVTGTAAFDVGTAYHDYATIKYNSSGVRQWVRFYDGAGENWDEAQSLVLDSGGNVIVTGYSVGSATGYDFATIKYNPIGEELWAQRHDGPGSGVSHDIGVALAADDAGNVYVAGTSALNYATVKYSGSGQPIWESRFGAAGEEIVAAVAIDATGVYVTGKSLNDYVTLKYDFAGAEVWEARYDGPGTGPDGATAIALDGAGNVLVTGSSGGSGTGLDFATIKYGQSTVGVAGAGSAPRALVLEQNRPNPFNPRTTIRFESTAEGWARLVVLDASGRRVKKLAEREFGRGVSSITWDGRNDAGVPVPSGTYFYRLETMVGVETRRMTLMK